VEPGVALMPGLDRPGRLPVPGEGCEEPIEGGEELVHLGEALLRALSVHCLCLQRLAACMIDCQIDPPQFTHSA
jgi:hypothetical protein